MTVMFFIIILGFILIGGGWVLGKGLGNLLFGGSNDYVKPITKKDIHRVDPLNGGPTTHHHNTYIQNNFYIDQRDSKKGLE